MSKFQVGDVVKHRTSGERGIISRVCVSCVEHPGFLECFIATSRPGSNPHRYEPTGAYEVSVAFGKTVITDEHLLEVEQ